MYQPKDFMSETTPLASSGRVASSQRMLPTIYNDDSDENDEGEEYFSGLKEESIRRESRLADNLSMRLLAVDDDDSETEAEILNETLNLAVESNRVRMASSQRAEQSIRYLRVRKGAHQRLLGMVGLFLLGLGILVAAMIVGVQFLGPPSQPVGPYMLVERQVSTPSGINSTFSHVILYLLTQISLSLHKLPLCAQPLVAL